MSAATPESFGQIVASNDFDRDFMMLRSTVTPDFRHHYDDYTQYAPAALMVGLKACGYHGRSDWGRMLVSDAFSVAAMTAVVNGIKYSAKRLRPDASTYNSFPSGHTATAFMTATMLHKEYEGRSPWFSIGGYTLAAITGVQLEIPVVPGIGVCARILEFQTKVMAGMARMQKRTGFDLCGNIGLSLITDNNFKIKAFGEFNSVSISSKEPWINSFIAGFSTGFFW